METLTFVRSTRIPDAYDRLHGKTTPYPEWDIEYPNGTHAWLLAPSLRHAVNQWFGLHAWPGGSPIAYFYEGGILCGQCAAQTFFERAKRIPGQGAIVGEDIPGAVAESAEYDETCDGCGRLIISQNRCPDHGYQPDAIVGEDAGEYRCPVCEGWRRCDDCWNASPDVDESGYCDHCRAMNE